MKLTGGRDSQKQKFDFIDGQRGQKVSRNTLGVALEVGGSAEISAYRRKSGSYDLGNISSVHETAESYESSITPRRIAGQRLTGVTVSQDLSISDTTKFTVTAGQERAKWDNNGPDAEKKSLVAGAEVTSYIGGNILTAKAATGVNEHRIDAGTT